MQLLSHFRRRRGGSQTHSSKHQLDENDISTKEELEEIQQEAALKDAKRLYERNHVDSIVTDLTGHLPRFSLEEVVLGDVLGRGKFGTVYEIEALQLPDDHNNDHGDDNDEERQHRQFLSENCLRRRKVNKDNTSSSRQTLKEARYAVKFISKDITSNPQLLKCASYDMAVETRCMATILHPNICKIRAIAKMPGRDQFHSSHYFIIMDRLYETLQQRLETGIWKKPRQSRKRNNKMMTLLKKTPPFRKPTAIKTNSTSSTANTSTRSTDSGSNDNDNNNNNSDDIRHHNLVDHSQSSHYYQDRVRCAFDISAAIEYLHGLNIIYRDLKPSNMAFDVRGDIKLFDFGTAAELRPSYRDLDHPHLYHLTQMVGSPRYMAPEVALGLPYNELCDIYSFSILCWELLSLQLPYSKHKTIGAFQKYVWNHDERIEDRPSLLLKNHQEWNDDMIEMFEKSWTSDLSQRLSMSDVKKILKEECIRSRYADKNDPGEGFLNHSCRRSTNIFLNLSISLSSLNR